MHNPFEEINIRLACIEATLRELKNDLTRKNRGETSMVADRPQFVSKRQAARLLDCSPSTIDNYARAGRITRHYVGKSVRFDRQEVLGLARSTKAS